MGTEATKTLTQEAFLAAFLDMSCSIRGNRLLEHLSFNEMIICNMLIKARRDGTEVFASRICEQMHLYKSQTNRILTSLEKKGIISRSVCKNDQRRQIITLNEDSLSHYSEEHKNVMDIIAHIHDTLGTDRLRLLTSLLEEATAAAEEKMY